MRMTLCQWTSLCSRARVAKVKDDKGKNGKTKSNTNKDKKCFYFDKIGHVRADCRKKKRDDEERKTTLAQNRLTSSPVTTTPPGLVNVPTSTSGPAPRLSDKSLSRPTSRMMNSSPMRIFALPVVNPVVKPLLTPCLNPC